ncbi:dGTPase [Roseateles sp. BYS180W]|uniref:DGTPase n=1 Tax=Roseateles rivi TaxID=3299028 RepID=A0ABW7FUC9_9BURK
MQTQYTPLLSGTRLRSSSVKDRPLITEAESDRGRVLFCPAFRRLQQKAQVFSMEPNAAVRSRLTHSFEVSQMGRYIADSIGPELFAANLASATECNALVTFVETACLMHDIGNPPFGHFGEAAIAQWFESNGADAIRKACGDSAKNINNLNDQTIKDALADFLEFDGNPQGLRVVAKLQRNSDEFGLNLTKTSIASFLKYTRAAGAPFIAGTPFTKKAGYFKTEEALVRHIWNEFDYKNPQRFPLAYIVEAADDLAYCISDLEDSIEKKLLNQKIALSEVYKTWKEQYPPDPDSLHIEIEKVLKAASVGEINGRTFTYTDFRTALNRHIVKYCAKKYIEDHAKIINGTAQPLLTTSSAAGKILSILKNYCQTHVYRHESVQRIELAGHAAIYGLLERFRCLLEANRERFDKALDYSNNTDSAGKPIVLERKLLTLFPKKYIDVYKHDLSILDKSSADFLHHEWVLRAHLVTDFISGMTDDFAMATYRTLSGMRL